MYNHVDFTQQSPVILSFCPGIRGIERGLERIFRSVRTCAYVEIEAFIVENLLAAMEEGLVDTAPIWTNLKTFNPKPFRGKVDGIIGGYPCQPFSLAGKREGENDPRHLWPFIREHVRTIQPGWCFFENVSGHLTLGFDVVKAELEEMGYFVEAGIYTAEEVGAPHRRERLFILAIKMEYTDNNATSGFNTRTSGEIRMDVERNSVLHIRRGKEEYNLNTSSTHVANPDNPRSIPPESRSIFNRAQDDARREEQPLIESDGYGLELADTRSSRDQIRVSGQEQREERFAGEFNNNSIEHRFPAGQGVYQHPWEEPRTIESSVEYTINGYNFTEDLHRAIGNSVVEQTAELAFRDLWRKVSDWYRFVNG